MKRWVGLLKGFPYFGALRNVCDVAGVVGAGAKSRVRKLVSHGRGRMALLGPSSGRGDTGGHVEGHVCCRGLVILIRARLT